MPLRRVTAIFDTARAYANEKLVEPIAESGLPREEFFITSKVWLDNYGYEESIPVCP